MLICLIRALLLFSEYKVNWNYTQENDNPKKKKNFEVLFQMLEILSKELVQSLQFTKKGCYKVG